METSSLLDIKGESCTTKLIRFSPVFVLHDSCILAGTKWFDVLAIYGGGTYSTAINKVKTMVHKHQAVHRPCV